MSNPRVTITLGRTGQVVERGGGGGPESKFPRGNVGKVSGSKRSIGDNAWADNKRQRGGGMSAGNVQLDHQLSRNDLRLKLMRKRRPKHSPNRRDLHEAKLSNTFQSHSSHHLPRYAPEANGSSNFRKMASRESADDLLLVNSLRNPYSARALNGLRGRSPDRTFRTLGSSPPRRFDELWKGTPIRIGEISRVGQFPSNGVISAPRAMGLPIPLKGSSGAAKLVSHFPPRNGIMQQSSVMVDEPRTVAGFLHTLGLEKYAIHFQAEEVDMTVLRQMGDKDLKDLGLPMGPRKKILLALSASRPKRRQL